MAATPSDSDLQVAHRSVLALIPRRWAMAATFWVPAMMPRRTKAQFDEWMVASMIVPMPPLPSAKFDTGYGFGVPPGLAKTHGLMPLMMSLGDLPSSMSVASTNVLNDEPTWRLFWVARLYL